MTKFNVGDRVKLVEVDAEDEKYHGLKVGMVGTVVANIDNYACTVFFDNWEGGWGANSAEWYVCEDQIKKYKENRKEKANESD